MTMTEEYDEQRDRQADDMIEKFIEDGLTPLAAARKWELLGRDMPDSWIAEYLNKKEE